jgi:hypothetical protein
MRLLLLLLLIGCSSTKKTVKSHVVTADTTTAHTEYQKIDTSKYENVTAVQGLSVDVYYDTSHPYPAAQALEEAKQRPMYKTLINSFPDHSRITHIHLSVDSGTTTKTIAAGVTTQLRKDTASGHHEDAIVATMEETTRRPWWIYLAAFLILLVIIYRIGKKHIP